MMYFTRECNGAERLQRSANHLDVGSKRIHLFYEIFISFITLYEIYNCIFKYYQHIMKDENG